MTLSKISFNIRVKNEKAAIDRIGLKADQMSISLTFYERFLVIF